MYIAPHWHYIREKKICYILLSGTVSLANALRNRKPHGHALQAVGTYIYQITISQRQISNGLGLWQWQ